jgi:hypothetical protein
MTLFSLPDFGEGGAGFLLPANLGGELKERPHPALPEVGEGK